MRLVLRLALIAGVVLWTTARHEFSHVIAAYLEGADIQTIRLLPGIHDDLGFYFGYVEHSGDVSWLTDAAPFFADIFLLAIAAILLIRLPRESKWRLYVVLFGVVSPLADLSYGYFSGLWRPGTDAADLLLALPPLIVHSFFLVAIVLGLFFLRFSRLIGTMPKH